MKQIILMSLVLLIGIALANDARTGALGGSMPFYLDDSQILVNPALMHRYGSRAIIEAGTFIAEGLQPSGQSGYGAIGITENFYLGAGLMRVKDDFATISLPGGLSTPQNNLDMMLGFSFGSLALGVCTHFGGWKQHAQNDSAGSTTSETTQKTGIMAFDIGGTYSADEMLADASFEIRMNSYIDEQIYGDTEISQENDGGLGMTFQARAFLPVYNFKLVPAVSFDMFGYTPKTVYTDSTVEGAKYSDMTLSFLVGANIPVFTEGWIAPGVGFRYNTTKSEEENETYSWNTMVMPEVYLATEIPVTKWAVARLGYHRYLGSYSTKYENSEDKESTETSASIPSIMQPDQVSIGAGFKLMDGKICIDGTIGEQFLHEGTFILSGMEDNLFGMVSLGVLF